MEPILRVMAIFLSLSLAVPLLAAENQAAPTGPLILSSPAETDKNAENHSPYAMADIIGVVGGEPVQALRPDIGEEAVVSFSVADVLLVDLLAALALALDDGTDRTGPVEVIAEDDAALLVLVTMTVDLVSVEEAIDLAAVASGCNIYRDGQLIIVDLCR